MISNGAAMFMCSTSTPLLFGVEISYDLKDLQRSLPPVAVTWLVDDTQGKTTQWKRQGLYVMADHQTAEEIATAAKNGKAYVGIRTGALTSLFDVKGLVSGLRKLASACG